MSLDTPQPPENLPPEDSREALEARLTALLLGELSAEDAVKIRAAIAQDAELGQLRDRLALTMGLVREAASSLNEEAAPAAEPLTLSSDRREKLLKSFKVVRPKELAKRRVVKWRELGALAAMVVGFLVVVAVLNLDSRESVQVSSSIASLDSEMAFTATLERARSVDGWLSAGQREVQAGRAQKIQISGQPPAGVILNGSGFTANLWDNSKAAKPALGVVDSGVKIATKDIQDATMTFSANAGSAISDPIEVPSIGVTPRPRGENPTPTTQVRLFADHESKSEDAPGGAPAAPLTWLSASVAANPSAGELGHGKHLAGVPIEAAGVVPAARPAMTVVPPPVVSPVADPKQSGKDGTRGFAAIALPDMSAGDGIADGERVDGRTKAFGLGLESRFVGVAAQNGQQGGGGGGVGMGGGVEVAGKGGSGSGGGGRGGGGPGRSPVSQRAGVSRLDGVQDLAGVLKPSEADSASALGRQTAARLTTGGFAADEYRDLNRNGRFEVEGWQDLAEKPKAGQVEFFFSSNQPDVGGPTVGTTGKAWFGNAVAPSPSQPVPILLGNQNAKPDSVELKLKSVDSFASGLQGINATDFSSEAVRGDQPITVNRAGGVSGPVTATYSIQSDAGGPAADDQRGLLGDATAGFRFLTSGTNVAGVPSSWRNKSTVDLGFTQDVVPPGAFVADPATGLPVSGKDVGAVWGSFDTPSDAVDFKLGRELLLRDVQYFGGNFTDVKQIGDPMEVKRSSQLGFTVDDAVTFFDRPGLHQSGVDAAGRDQMVQEFVVPKNESESSKFYRSRTLNTKLREELPQREKILAVQKNWPDSTTLESLPVPNAYARTNWVKTGPARAAVSHKLNSIRLGELSADSLPLSEVIKQLDKQILAADPTHKGINFLFSNPVDQPPIPRGIEPATGLPVEAADVMGEGDISTATVKIDWPLRDLTVTEALDVISKSTDRPLNLSVTDFGVVVSAKPKLEKLDSPEAKPVSEATRYTIALPNVSEPSLAEKPLRLETTANESKENALAQRQLTEAKSSEEKELARLLEVRDRLYGRVWQEKVDQSIPRDAIVEVIDPAVAEPAKKSGFWNRVGGVFASDSERSVKLAVEKDATDIESLGTRSSGGFDPFWMQTQFEKIQSKAVLGKVIEKLNLNEAWSGKEGQKLSTDETYALLKKRLVVRQDPKSNLLDITAKSDDPEEAARIANAVAAAYRQSRLDTWTNLSLAGLNKLEKVMEEHNKQIAELHAKIDSRKQQTNRVEADVPPPKLAPTAAIPQPEIFTKANAFSTFSLNVSDVSFKLAAAALEKGQMPDPATVRSEEFINAFDYHDPEPKGSAPIAFVSERARYPFAHNRDLLRFSIKTATSGRQAGRPLNLVLLLDNSGSMERADRVRIIRECLRVLATQLRPEDRISVVAFARTARLWIDGIAGNQAGELAQRVGDLAPQGGTNLEEAMNLAYQTAHRHFMANGVNRVVLLTDGAANLGDVQPASLKKKVETHRQQGVALDCFGIGWEGFNDDLLESLSRNGDGRYGFVNSPAAAATEFAGQLAGALQVTASDVKVQVEFNPKRVTSYRQIGYAKHQLKKEQFRDNTVDAAEMAAAESGNALYTVELNPSGEGPVATVRVRFKIPGSMDFREHEWTVPYEGPAKALEQSTATLRLAGVASAFSEWLVSSPFAGEVTTDALLKLMSGVPESFGSDPRPKNLEAMLRQAKSLSGK